MTKNRSSKPPAPKQTPGIDLEPLLYRSVMVADMVARIGRDSAGVIDTVEYRNEDAPGFDDLVTAAFLEAEEQGLITTGVDTSMYASASHMGCSLTAAGQAALDGVDRAAWRDTIGVSPSGHLPSPGDRALWLWLLRNGGQTKMFGSYPELNGNVMHVALCGLDFDASSSASDDVWTTKGGTFAEPERHVGVSGRAVCRCGEVGAKHSKRPRFAFGGMEIYAEMPSIVDLIKAMVV